MSAIASPTVELARARGLAARSGLVSVDLDDERIDPHAVAKMPLELMSRFLAFPYAMDDGTLRVALADPATGPLLAREVPMPLEFVVASRASIVALLDSLRHTRRRNGTLMAIASVAELGAEPETALIKRAADAGATDLHFIPTERGLSVRARIDGVLREIASFPDNAAAAAAVSRLKVRARLDIAETRRAQEGRMRLVTDVGREFDVRLTVIPTIAGEGAAVRLLEHDSRPPSLTEVGLSVEHQLELERVVTAAAAHSS